MTSFHDLVNKVPTPDPMTVAGQALIYIIIATAAMGCVCASIWFVKKIIRMLAGNKAK